MVSMTSGFRRVLSAGQIDAGTIRERGAQRRCCYSALLVQERLLRDATAVAGACRLWRVRTREKPLTAADGAGIK